MYRRYNRHSLYLRASVTISYRQEKVKARRKALFADIPSLILFSGCFTVRERFSGESIPSVPPGNRIAIILIESCSNTFIIADIPALEHFSVSGVLRKGIHETAAADNMICKAFAVLALSISAAGCMLVGTAHSNPPSPFIIQYIVLAPKRQ